MGFIGVVNVVFSLTVVKTVCEDFKGGVAW